MKAKAGISDTSAVVLKYKHKRNRLSHLGPGWGVGPSDCVEEVGGGGGVVGGGEVSIG